MESIPQPESHKGWQGNTKKNLAHADDKADKMRKALQVLHTKEANEIAAAQKAQALADAEAERKLQEKLAAERKAQEEAIRQQLLADERFRKAEEAKAAAADAAALAAATEEMRREARQERENKEKDYANIVMKDVAKRVGTSVLKCLHESRMKFAVLKVCEERLEIREKRPPSELFKDHVTDALLNEQKLLKAARVQLLNMSKEGDKIINELYDVTQWLSTAPCRGNVKARKERAEREKALTPSNAVNNKTPLNKSASVPSLPALNNTTSSMEISPPTSPSGGCNPRLYSSMTKGLSMQLVENASTRELLDLSKKLVEKGFAYNTKALDLIEKTTKECSEATVASNASLDKRQAEYEELKHTLHAQITSMSNLVKDAEAHISRLRKRELFLPKDKPKPENKELEQAEAALKDLLAARTQAENDYRSKHNAWKMDISCRTLTPTRVDPREPSDRPEFKMTNKSGMSSTGNLSLPSSPNNMSMSVAGFDNKAPPKGLLT